ncbi:MAG: pilus assembly protein TadG-related protein [Acidimicrobiia bacterium]|nr:pilus assembly protein TadG-related protein [Acidimicrobiia bacterium]
MFVVTMTTALLLVAGLVFDGGRMIAAHRDADAVASAAAREAERRVDEAGLRLTNGAPERQRCERTSAALLGRHRLHRDRESLSTTRSP